MMRILPVHSTKPLAARAGLFVINLYVVLFAIFLLAPIVIVIATSFTPTDGMDFPFHGFSLRWYRRVIEYKPFLTSLGTSLYIALVSAIFAIFLSVPCALALAKLRGRGANSCIGFLLSPLALPPLVIGLSLLYFLSSIHINNAVVSLLIAHTAVSVPYVTRTVLAVQRNIDSRYSEAASVLGASRAQAFWHVSLPLIGPGIFAGALFSILISLDNIGVSYFFGTADVTVLPVVLLSYIENQFDPAIAAISTIQIAITFALLLIVERTYGLKALTAQ